MNKKQIFSSILLSVILSLLIVIFLSGYISAKLSTNEYLKRFNIFQPQSPIVINRKEEIRISDSGDIQEAVAKVKSRVSLIVTKNNNSLQVTGNAINLTSDGYYITSKSAVIDPKQQYSVVQANGRTILIEQIIFDPATNLAILKTTASDVPVATLGFNRELVPGQKIIFVKGSLVPFSANSLTSFISGTDQEVAGQAFRSDYPSRTFGVQAPGSLIPGQAIINLDAEVLGMWDGTQIIPAGILQSAQSSFFTSKTAIVRPRFGFEYRVVTPPEISLLVVPGGALVTKIIPASPAALVGLLEGDTIIKVAGIDISQGGSLEKELEKVKPADPVELTVFRAGKTVSIIITAETLK